MGRARARSDGHRRRVGRRSGRDREFGRRLIAGDAFETESGVLRERLARATLLGLEFLVAADIIATVAAVPTLSRLLMLTGIILLRTFLSATLMLEVEGRWPWSAGRRESRPFSFGAPT
jgi:Protein of unknown function (DUF1622)